MAGLWRRRMERRPPRGGAQIMRGRSIGMILLGIYLVLVGLMALIAGFHFPYSPIIMGLLALLAGILIIAGR